jgi:TonB family protein
MGRKTKPVFVTLLVSCIAAILLTAVIGSEAIAQNFDTRPRIDQHRTSEPKRPRGAPRDESGEVTLSVDIDEKGTVIDVRVISVDGADVFGPAAADYIKHAHFYPAMKDGKPIAVAGYTIKVAFPPCDCHDRR